MLRIFWAGLLPAVLALAACGESTPGESSCSDGVDNDMNGQTDCADTACAAHAACVTTDAGISDDGGGAGCGPESCMGCCDADRCQSGMSLAACGWGGLACEVCLLGASCEPTGCEGGPVACGPANCAGCCAGDICVGGDRLVACGTGGGACDACDSWEVCSAAGACGVDPASEWQISLIDAVIPPTNLGSDWDGVGAGECDPFVELRVGSAGAMEIVMPGIGDTITPDWTMGGTTTVLSPRVTVAEILAFLRFDMFDDDSGIGPFNPPDTIGMCRYAEGETPFNGEIVTLVCDPDPVLEHAGYTLRWQLVPG